MIGNITTGTDFRGLVNYLLDPNKTPEIIDTNLAGTDSNTMIWELNACAEQRPTTKKPVKHISIGFAPGDNNLSHSTIKDIARTLISGLGYNNNQYLVVKHDRYDPGHDRTHSHDHFHILINAIDCEGKRIHDGYDKRKLEKLLRQQELEHGLIRVLSSDRRSYKASSAGQVQRMMREIEQYQADRRIKKPTVPYMVKIQAGIDMASRDRPSLTTFLARLQQLGIDTKLKIESETIKGISYRLQEFKVRGCKLHQASFPQLIKHRVNYDPNLDLTVIARVNQNQKIELTPGEVNWSQTRMLDYVPNRLRTMLDKASGEQQLQLDRKDIVQKKQRPSKGFEIDH